MSLLSALPLNQKLEVIAELAKQAVTETAEATAAAEAAAAARVARARQRQQTKYYITESGHANGLTVNARPYTTALKAHQATRILRKLSHDPEKGLSKADLVEALEGTDFRDGSIQEAKALVDHWIKEFNKMEWIAKAR